MCMPWYVYMHCVCHSVYCSVHVTVRGQLTGNSFLLYHVVPWDRTQAIKLAVWLSASEPSHQPYSIYII